jgi:hypothetical protein
MGTDYPRLSKYFSSIYYDFLFYECAVLNMYKEYGGFHTKKEGLIATKALL